ncbi:MAG: AAA family ATPase [Pseudomonadota bacterium]
MRHDMPPQGIEDVTAQVLADRPGFAAAEAMPPRFEVVDEGRRRQRPPDRPWLVKDWLPCGHLGTLFGAGADGKTLLALQLAASVALGERWLGFETEQSNALCYLSEDDPDEIARREHDIAAAIGRKPLDWDGTLTCISGVGRDTLLCTFPPANGGAGRLTAEWEMLHDRVVREQARLVVLDNAGTLYGGNENDRAQVGWFLGILAGLAHEIGGAVLLLGHPPKSDATYSGSTAWRNRPRLLAHLKRVKDKEGNATTYSELRREKANYGQPATYRLAWYRGAFRPDMAAQETEGEKLQRQMRHREALQKLVDGLRTLLGRHTTTSPSPNAANYAPKVVFSEGLAGDFTKAELAAALNAGIDEGRINPAKKLWKGNDRRWKKGVAPADWSRAARE